MHRVPPVDDGVAIRAESVAQAQALVKLRPVLVEEDDAQAIRPLDRANVRAEFSRQQFDERRLPTAVRSQEAQPRARGEGQAQVLKKRLVAQALGQVLAHQKLARLPA